MRYALIILAALALASPAFAGQKNRPGPAEAAKADARVASDQAAITKMQNAGNPNPRVLDNMQNHILPASERRAALIHASCGC